MLDLFVVAWPDLDIGDVDRFLMQAEYEPLLWEAKEHDSTLTLFVRRPARLRTATTAAI